MNASLKSLFKLGCEVLHLQNVGMGWGRVFSKQREHRQVARGGKNLVSQ